MSYSELISEIGIDAERLETSYRAAVDEGDEQAFAAAVDEAYNDDPANLLYAAWHYRLVYALADRLDEWRIAWGWAIPLAVINGLLLWWLSDEARYSVQLAGYPGYPGRDLMPLILLLWAPISAVVILGYLVAAGDRNWRRTTVPLGALILLPAYVLWVYPRTGAEVLQEQYLILMAIHLPLLAWCAVGITLLTGFPDAENRTAFLLKSLEVFVLAGLFAIAGGLFTSISIGLFDALGVELPIWVVRLFVAGGGGLIPVLATAIVYNPNEPPAAQSFDQGISRLIALIMRLLLPLTLAVLLVYLAFIPMNFRAPYENRDVLLIYNAMLFAVMALLVGATPAHQRDVSKSVATWLRRGIIFLVLVATLVSLYALSAIVLRTWQDRLTPNRLAFIGWNVANMGILLILLWKQAVTGREGWLAGLRSAFAAGTVIYLGWTLVVILAVPWLFGINQGDIATLSVPIQQLVYEETYPILLKCNSSPHIYLLDQGEKRWIKDIPTFEAQGFQWVDVEMVGCNILAAVPDGPPIPPDAGTPPQP